MPHPRPHGSAVCWLNTPVIVEALQRYQRGELARPLRLWLETVLELERPSIPPGGP